MQNKVSKIWVVIITLNIIITLVALAGIVFLLVKISNPDNDTDNIISTSITPTPTKIQLQTEFNPKVDFKFTLANLPRIDGSTSNVPLRNLILCELLNYTCKWEEFSPEDTTKERYMTIDAPQTILDAIKLKSVNSTTHNAYVKLINGETDIIFVATQPSEEEQALMTEKGVELDIKPIALDAFVFIVNKDNIVTSLTLQQIVDIYTGKITNWKELQGRNAKLNAYQREDNSGSQELMKLLVLKGEKPIGAPELTISGMMGLINRVTRDVDGLGYSVYYYEEFMVQNTSLKLLAINGINPNYQSLEDQSYPLTSPVYVVTRKGIDTTSATYNLAQWMLTEEGQQVVKNSLYVPAINK